MKRVLGGAGSLWGGLQRTLNTVVMRLNVVICEIEGLRGFHLGIGMARFLHTHTRTHACTLTHTIEPLVRSHRLTWVKESSLGGTGTLKQLEVSLSLPISLKAKYVLW